MNGTSCTADGVAFDGVDDHVALGAFEFGGALRMEVLVKFERFNGYSRVLDFTNAGGDDRVVLSNTEEGAPDFNWAVRRGSSQKFVRDGAWGQHVVATASGSSMKVFKDGVLTGSRDNGHEPKVLTRAYHSLGGNVFGNANYFEGSIAFLRVWHGVLGEEEVEALHLERDIR